MLCFHYIWEPKGRRSSSLHDASRRPSGSASVRKSSDQATQLRGRAHLPFLSGSGHAIKPEFVMMVEWITKPLLSPPSFCQPQGSTVSSAAANVPSSCFSSTANPAVASKTGIEKSVKLFEHTISTLLQDDAQEFILSVVEEESARSLHSSSLFLPFRLTPHYTKIFFCICCNLLRSQVLQEV